MSGGSFNYAYQTVISFTEELDEKIYQSSQSDSPRFEDPKVEEALAYIASESARIAKLMREAEWLYSGDTGEEEFLKSVKELS